MKKSRITFIAFELALAALTIFFISQIFSTEKKQKRVAVIIESSGDEKWDSFINGIKQAADINNIHLIICNTDEIENAADERILITEQLDNGVDGFIIQAAPGLDVADMLKETTGDKAVVLVANDAITQAAGDDINAASGFCTIMPDNYRMGYMLGEELLNVNNNDIKGKTVGIVGGFAETDCDIKRSKGLRDALADSGCTISWQVNTTYDSGIITTVKNQERVDFLVALETETLEQLGELKAELDMGETQLYGVGNSLKCVYYLDNGILQGLLMMDGYGMGYDSVTEIARALEQKFYTIKGHTTDVRLLRKEDIYTKENEEFLHTYE